MTRIANISLAAPRPGAVEVEVDLGPQRFLVSRYNVGRDFERMRQLLRELDGDADVIAISGLPPSVTVGHETYSHPEVDALLALATSTPVVTGQELRSLYQRWCLRHLVRTEPDLLGGRSVGMYMGMLDLELAPILEEAARVVRFGDPFLHIRVPTVLTSSVQLASYARATAPLLAMRSMSSLSANRGFLYGQLHEVWAKKMATVDVIVGQWAHLQTFGGRELAGKIVITDRAAPHAIQWLRERGVVHVAAAYPSLALQHNLDWSVMEAMLWVTDGHLRSSSSSSSDREAALRGLDRLADAPQVQRFFDLPRRRRRYAFVVQPRDQKDLLRYPLLKPVSRLPAPARSVVEWLVAQTPPRRYGELVGAVSDDGAEADGLVIALPSTPDAQTNVSPRRARRQLRRAVRRAEEWGAEIVSLGPTARPMVEAAAAVARTARIPVTTGHAYQASTTFAAARSAVLRMGFVGASDDGALLRARCLVLGASGSFGSMAAHLCAGEYTDVVLAGPRPDRLLELKTAIEESGARATVTCTTEPDEELAIADLVIVCTGRGDDVVDIDRIKPGGVVCDVARPPALSPEAALMRSDVLVIDGGVVELPGRAKMTCDIGLPGRSIYATLAEATLLALEGRFEAFSAVAATSLERVREIDAIGRRHGARLAALRGPGGVVTDEDIELCRAAALRRRGADEVNQR
jgi:predicted amino acid dehydrogenase